MDFSKLSVDRRDYAPDHAVVIYGPFALFKINQDGIKRYIGVNKTLPFIGDNGAIKVLRSYEGYAIPQNWTWSKESFSIASIAHGGKIIPVGPISFFLHIKDAAAYLMVTKQGSNGKRDVNTVAAISDAGLAVAGLLSVDFGIARDEGRCRVWRVK